MKYWLLSFFLILPVAFSQSAEKVEKITLVADGDILLKLDKNSMGIKKGEHVDDVYIKKEVHRLREYLYGRGYWKSKINYKKVALGDGIEIIFTILAEKMAKVVDVKITSDNINLVKEYEKKVAGIKSKPFDKLRFKIILDEISREIFESGYYYSNISFKKNIIKGGNENIVHVGLDVHIQFGFQYNFHFEGNIILNRFELVDFVRQKILANKNDDLEIQIKRSILEKYKQFGIYGTVVEIRSERTISINNKVTMKNFFVMIKEGKKIELKNFVFEGNEAISLEELESIYYENSTSLASQGYYDKEYLENFFWYFEKKISRKRFCFCRCFKP